MALLIMVLSLALLLFVCSLHQSSSGDWEYARQLDIKTSCRLECEQDPKCVKWTHLKLLNKRLCVIESAKLQRLKIVNPDIFAGARYPSRAIAKEGSLKFSHISSHLLIADPISIGGASLFNVEQHFVQGCEYTIATWAWIWRSRNTYDDSDFAIFRYVIFI